MTRPLIRYSSKMHLGAVVVLTAVQWMLFSADAIIGLAGLPFMVVWILLGILGDRRQNSQIASFHHAITWVIAAAIGYIPMVATMLGLKLVPG
jgi:hypothetical protein